MQNVREFRVCLAKIASVMQNQMNSSSESSFRKAMKYLVRYDVIRGIHLFRAIAPNWAGLEQSFVKKNMKMSQMQ